MLDTVSILGIILVAAFLQGLTGFGFALIALPLLGFFMDIKTSVPLMAMLAVGISLVLSIQLRKNIDLQSMRTLMLATLPGIPLGTYALKNLPTQGLSMSIGVLMVLFAAYMLFFKPKPRRLGVAVTSVAGFASGVFGSSIGTGGPPAIIYTTLQPWDKDQAKSTLAFYFTLCGMITVATHAISGMITSEVVRLYTLSLPSLGVGIWLGTIVYSRISDRGYKKLAFILVFLLGCMIFYRNI